MIYATIYVIPYSINDTQTMKRLYRFKLMDKLIHAESTGTPKEFAEKLSICVSYLHSQIKDLKEEYNAPIKYTRIRQTYYYDSDFSLKF
jgi:hypothetical protein